MAAQILDRGAERRVGFHLALFDLFLEPTVKPFHHRCAHLLVMAQTLFRREMLFSRVGVGGVDLGQRAQYVLAFGEKGALHFDEFSAGVRQTIGDDRPKLVGIVPRQCVAHLDRWRKFRDATPQHLL